MKINLKDRNVQMTLGVIVVVLIVGLFASTMNKKSASKSTSNKQDVLPEVEILPTVDSSVQVSLTADKLKQEATLEISSVPAGTISIEYELSYDADVDGNKVPKGAIGTIEFDGEDPVSREITMGTCSSGTCKYDKGVEKIKATLKFSGKYGDRLFEREFEI